MLIITTQIESVPWIADEKRATVAEEAPGFWRASVRYGFMERPDTPGLLAQLKEHGCTIDLADVTYYVGHETVTRRQDGGGLPRWQEEMFAFMERNASHVTDYFNLPSDQVVEIGRQIAISQACRIGYGQGCPVDAAHKMRGRWTGTRRPSTIAARML